MNKSIKNKAISNIKISNGNRALDVAQKRLNAWVNAFSGMGTPRDTRMFSFFSGANNTISPQELDAFYSSNGLARTIVDRVVKEALRKEPIFLIDDKPIDASILQPWNVIGTIQKAAMFGRLYGISAILLNVEDGKDPSEPVDLPIRRNTLQWLKILDVNNKLEVRTVYSNSSGLLSGQPMTYDVSLANGQNIVIHADRLIMFSGLELPDSLKAKNRGHDASVLTPVYDTLNQIAATEFSVHALVQGASQAVYKVKDLAEQVAQDQNRILDLMTVVDMSRNSNKAIILDADGEDFTQVGAQNLTGIKDLLDLSYKRLAAVSNIPLTVLMGQSPAGLNATGESDSRNWYDLISEEQNKLRVPMATLVSRIVESAGTAVNGNLTIKFQPLWSIDETLELAKDKTRVETAKMLIDAGIFTPEELRSTFINRIE